MNHNDNLETNIVWDAHCCPSFRSSSLSFLSRYKSAKFDFVSLNVGFGPADCKTILSTIHKFRGWIEQNQHHYALVTNVADVVRAKLENKLAIAFDLEGCDFLENDYELLSTYYSLGVKQVALVYNRNNMVGGGCQDNDSGLTAYGKEIIKQMNRIGLVIDCSHAGFKTTMDIMEQSNKPIIFSHSNPLSMHRHNRNIIDTQIKSCAEINGVIGINGVSIFLGDDNTGTEKLVEHIDYIVQKVGTRHVGLGLDFTIDQDEAYEFTKKYPQYFPRGTQYKNVNFVQPEQLIDIKDKLIKIGYSETNINDVLGNNFLRIAKNNWK